MTDICFLLFSAPCLGEGLKCYVCVSNKSWEECDNTKEIRACLPGHDDVCIKGNVIEHNKDTEKGYKETFMKMCGTTDLCTNKDCKIHGKYCKVDCCHSDICNPAARPVARMTITLLGSLAVIFIYLLQLRMPNALS